MDWQKKSYSLSAGSHTLKWVYSKDSSGYGGEDCGWVDGLMVGTTSIVGQPDAMSEALDSHLKFTESGGQGWWIASGESDEYYYEADAAQSDYDLPDNGGETCLQAIVDSDSAQTVKFYWKVSSEQSHDYLQFYIDSTLKDQISGEVGWQQKSYAVDSGIHILKWRFIKNSSGSSGDNCGWVDFVQWTGPSPDQDPANWQEIAYKHDVAGRRVEKKVDGYSTRYVCDGSSVIAEYDGNNNLLRKYIYGPGIDQPISMIEVAQSNATYYYHFDGLGSVVALSNAGGDTVQTYQYSVYGEVAVEDANHTNPYMFAGVRYDIEIGLYYNRARYYNPFTGRFLQTDPIGYETGMNIYAYCGNNSLNRTDPSGLRDIEVKIPMETVPQYGKGETAQTLVESFLSDVGFYEEYKYWTVTGVEIVDNNFVVTLHIDDARWKYEDPNFGIADVGGVRVCTIGGIGRLDSMDWTLNRIIAASVHRVNEWSYLAPGGVSIHRLINHCDTPFFKTKIDKWKYRGETFDNSEVNFILEGHAMRHLGLNYNHARALVYAWENFQEAFVDRGDGEYFRGPWDLSRVMYWFNKGWGEYDKRKGW